MQLQYTAPRLAAKVKEIVKTCRTCQLRKKKPHARTAPAQPIPVLSQPFHMLGCDAVGPTQDATSRGNRYLLVAVDYLTRWPFAQAVPNINKETTVGFCQYHQGRWRSHLFTYGSRKQFHLKIHQQLSQAHGL